VQVQALLPDSRMLRCDGVEYESDKVVVVVRSVGSCAACPSCDRSSERVHSRYVRRLVDLPWQGLRVEVCWQSRRFFCTNPCCAQRIFTERLPAVAAPHARKTNRLTIVMRAIALACGGEEGARLADRLGIRISSDTMVREIRRSPCNSSSPVRVVGVDDWALRRGQRYGTILIDLEQHRPVDLLPERSSAAFAAWLRSHPEVEIVSRDRGDYYIKGADIGAPQAIQVADRWHLLHNLQEALVRLVERFRKPLKEAASRIGHEPELGKPEPANAEDSASAAPEKQSKTEREQQERRNRRLDRYQQVMELHQQHVSQREIARRLGLHRRTVRMWLRAGCYPERAGRRCRRGVDGWTDYLEERWQAGCRNAATLTAELRSRGFNGSYDMVRRCVGKWRKHDEIKNRTVLQSASSPSHSPRSMAWLLFKPPDEREPEQQRLVQMFCEACPDVDQAVRLVRQFRRLVTQRLAEELNGWLVSAAAADAPVELQRFAAGLKTDFAAVKAALSLPWSNGQTEGQVNRLKGIKRQMYGRANFDLLRKRVLARTKSPSN
jgi:transposase